MESLGYTSLLNQSCATISAHVVRGRKDISVSQMKLLSTVCNGEDTEMRRLRTCKDVPVLKMNCKDEEYQEKIQVGGIHV